MLKLLIEENDHKGILNEVLIKVDDPKSKIPVLKEMLQVMNDNNGIGITANQVGLLDKMFVFTLNNGRTEFAINPRIIKVGGKRVDATEGCLSYPDKQVVVKRPTEIFVSYHNGYKIVTKKLIGLECRVFLHEADHCNGKCIVGV